MSITFHGISDVVRRSYEVSGNSMGISVGFRGISKGLNGFSGSSNGFQGVPGVIRGSQRRFRLRKVLGGLRCALRDLKNISKGVQGI